MLEALEAMSGLFLGIMIIGFLASGIFIWIGLKASSERKSSFKKIIFAAFISSLITYIVTIIFYSLPALSTFFGFSIGMLLSFLLLKKIFNLTLKKTFLIWTFFLFAHTIAVNVGAILFVGGIRDLIKIL